MTASAMKNSGTFLNFLLNLYINKLLNNGGTTSNIFDVVNEFDSFVFCIKKSNNDLSTHTNLYWFIE